MAYKYYAEEEVTFSKTDSEGLEVENVLFICLVILLLFISVFTFISNISVYLLIYLFTYFYVFIYFQCETQGKKSVAFASPKEEVIRFWEIYMDGGLLWVLEFKKRILLTL